MSRVSRCILCLTFHLLTGWRNVEVTERRASEEFALQTKYLVDQVFSEGEVWGGVGQLERSSPVLLYQHLLLEEARRLAQKLEFHHTLKHGS